jgi:diketogulonate reductase-like aldo/keto reductase
MQTDSSLDTVRRTLLKALATATLFPSMTMAAESPMILRRIPSSGEFLPALGLGTWQSFDVSSADDLAAAVETLRLLLEQGGTVVDSSPMYGRSEAVVGALAARLGITRKLFLATKVWTNGRDAGTLQMEDSLRKMKTDRMDLMQIHNMTDAATHVKTLRAWKEANRIRYWGVTHYHAGAYADITRFIRSEQPDFLQINYSMAEPESGNHLIPLARDLGIAVIVNRPFADGGLFNRVQGRSVPEWATEFDAVTWAQFFLKWILADTAVTCAIPGTRNPKYLLDNMAAGKGRLPDIKTRARMSAYIRG